MVAGAPRKVTFDFAGHSLAEIRKRAGDLQARVRLGADPAQERAQTRADVQVHRRGDATGLFGGEAAAAASALLHRGREAPLDLLCAVAPSPAPACYDSRCQRPPSSDRRRERTHHGHEHPALVVSVLRVGPSCAGSSTRIRVAGSSTSPTASATAYSPLREIKAVWDATAGPDDYSAIVRLLLLSGARANEIARLKPCEVFTDRLVLPPRPGQ